MLGCFANSAECIMNFLLPMRLPPWGRLHNAGCAGVGGCTRVRQLDHNSGTYALDEPLGEGRYTYIHIYIIFNLPFTFYAAALYRFQLIKPRISFKTRSKCNERR